MNDITVTAPRNWLNRPGIDLIKSFEGCAKDLHNGTFAAYPDPGSVDGKPWTIGWGSTGADVMPGVIWTQQKCDDRFETELGRYEQEVRKAIGDTPTTANQFDAMVSFHYNTGAIGRATLTKLHNAGNYAGAALEFGKWVKNDNKTMAGLERRRAAEAALYKS